MLTNILNWYMNCGNSSIFSHRFIFDSKTFMYFACGYIWFFNINFKTIYSLIFNYKINYSTNLILNLNILIQSHNPLFKDLKLSQNRT